MVAREVSDALGLDRVRTAGVAGVLRRMEAAEEVGFGPYGPQWMLRSPAVEPGRIRELHDGQRTR